MKNVWDPAIYELIEQRDWPAVRNALLKWPAPEVSDLLMALDRNERVLVFRLLPRQLSSEVAAYLSADDLNALLKCLTDEETRQLLANLRPDDRTEFLQELPGELVQRLLNLLSPEDLKEARQLLGYREDSVGRLMTPDYLAVRPDWTIAKALEHIRKTGLDRETIYTVYVVDSKWKLLDTIELARFILADPLSTVAELMDHSFVSIGADEDREKAVQVMQRYDLFVLPVVDSEGILLGIVTADDVMDVAQEEATEDFHKSAAVTPLADTYSDTPVWELYKKRIGWLVALVALNLVSSSVIAVFEETLTATIALAFFIPLLIDSGGNAGSQSATLMVRALATGDLRLGQWASTVTKELLVGISLGLTLGVASWVLGLSRGGIQMGFVVGISMVSIVLVANIIGATLPFLLTRLKIDPAVASSPLITTVADACGLIIYFTVARMILGG